MFSTLTQDEVVRTLRLRQGDVLGRLHGLTKQRDAGLVTQGETMALEQRLVEELGRIQDRLRLMGAHDYCGCDSCHPGRTTGAGPHPVER